MPTRRPRSAPRPRVRRRTPSSSSASSSAAPPNRTSRLSAKCRKKVRSVRPARSAISATVVCSKPRSPYSSIAACARRPAASGFQRAIPDGIRWQCLMTVTDKVCASLMSVADIKLRPPSARRAADHSPEVHHARFRHRSIRLDRPRRRRGADRRRPRRSRARPLARKSAGRSQARASRCARASLDDLATLHDAAASSDGVIHLAFKHDIAFAGDFDGAAEADRRAIETFGEALTGSGQAIRDRLRRARARTRAYRHRARRAAQRGRRGAIVRPAAPSADGPTPQLTLSFAGRGVRSSIVRLPPTCHGDGDNGFIPAAIGFAREKGAAAYVGDGANRWPAVHRDDAARLFRLALESAPAGSALHAIGDDGVPIREVAAVFSSQLGVPAAVGVRRAGRRVPGVAGRVLGAGQPGLRADHARAARLAAGPARA